MITNTLDQSIEDVIDKVFRWHGFRWISEVDAVRYVQNRSNGVTRERVVGVLQRMVSDCSLEYREIPGVEVPQYRRVGQ